MEQLRTIESKVLEILKDDEVARYDDMRLILSYYNRFGFIRAGDLPFENVIYNYKYYGLPCFESIRRARQRVQSCYPEYSRTPQPSGAGGIRIVIEVN